MRAKSTLDLWLWDGWIDVKLGELAVRVMRASLISKPRGSLSEGARLVFGLIPVQRILPHDKLKVALDSGEVWARLIGLPQR
jgi:hypothetical protein